MSKYVDGIEFVTEECYKCGIPFAFSADFQRRRLKDKASFYCPSGHRQAYVGKPEEERLRNQLRQKQRELEQQTSNAANLKVQRDTISRTYERIRDRVKNGVCPCCNRSFNNLREHMKTQHPEFGDHDTLKTMRMLFGLTQTGLAKEVGLPSSYISMYENEKLVPDYAKASIEQWVEGNS